MTLSNRTRNNRTHFTDPDYGISESEKLARFVVRLSYIDEGGAARFTAPSWSYHSPESRTTALRAARAERDRLLALSQFQKYIATRYADPSGRRRTHVKPTTTKQRGVIPELNGLHIKVCEGKPLQSGEPSVYMNVMAHIPDSEKGTKYRSWSVRKYGFSGALEKAACWRAEQVGSPKPTIRQLQNAEVAARKAYQSLLSGV